MTIRNLPHQMFEVGTVIKGIIVATEKKIKTTDNSSMIWFVTDSLVWGIIKERLTNKISN
jgi:hypothetical protein